MKRVLVIVGPTASGKTDLAVELALRYGGEVVSADSMQIYREMDVGTAKPDSVSMRGIQHRMIDVVGPYDTFNVARYKEAAEACIKEILAEGKLPIVAGGTGQYVNALVYNINYSEISGDPGLRNRLNEEAKASGNAHMLKNLAELDPEAASRLHTNNLKRIIRALEICLSGDMTKSEQDRRSRLEQPKYDYFIIGLNVEREFLYDRIDKRVDRMIENGLADEVRKLADMDLPPDATSMQGIGYRQMLQHFNGGMTFEEAVEKIKLETRHYAKRQFTWFRKLEGVNWIDVKRDTEYSEIIAAAAWLLDKNWDLR